MNLLRHRPRPVIAPMLAAGAAAALSCGVPPRALADEASKLAPAETVAGWTSLFDGSSTDAFRGFRMKDFPAGRWVIEDGCLKCNGGGGSGPNTDIITKEQYADFELTLECKTAPNANSGVIFRVTEKNDATWQTGPEFQLIDDGGNHLKADDIHSCGALYELAKPDAEAKVVKPVGEWNQVRIRLRRGRLEHWLNGAKVVECDLNGDEWLGRIARSKFKVFRGFGTQPKGHIALQDHGDVVWFRNIKVRDLDAKMPGETRLFDGKSLQGWTHHLEPDGKMEDTWRVEEGVLVCKGKPDGYIRTEKDHANYVLRLEWRFNPVTKEAGNSGVLLRMIGPDKVWPKSIEAQLHSTNAGDFWNIDDYPMKTDPARTNGRNTKKLRMAERPVGEWNEYEIIVDRGDIRLLVNGDEVNHAWDVAENAGKICLQSEGAEIQFRNIRLAPIP